MASIIFSPRVFCSSKLLYEIFEDKKKCLQAELLKKLWNSHVSFLIDDSNYEKEELNIYKEKIDEQTMLKANLEYNLETPQIDYRSNNKQLLTKENLKNIYNDIFIIDEKEESCDSYCKKFGMLVISEYNLKNLETIFFKTELRIKRGNLHPQIGNKIKPGWHSLFFNLDENEHILFKILPVNSILINDCYIFKNNSEKAVKNTISLINGILLASKNTFLQISIFTVSNGKNEGYFQVVFDQVKLEFPDIEIELIVHKNSNDLHARIIITNYTWMNDTQEKGFNLFKEEIANTNGSLDIKHVFNDFNNIFNTKLTPTVTNDINNFISLCKSERNKTLSNIERIEASELNQTKEEFYFSTLDDNKKLYTRLLTY